MLTQREKREILAKEFDQINVNHDDFISREELYNYLDSKVNKTMRWINEKNKINSVNSNSTVMWPINFMIEWIRIMMVV